MAEFGVQPKKTVIEVGFRWFARFLDPPNLQFLKKSIFTTPYQLLQCKLTQEITTKSKNNANRSLF